MQAFLYGGLVEGLGFPIRFQTELIGVLTLESAAKITSCSAPSPPGWTATAADSDTAG